MDTSDLTEYYKKQVGQKCSSMRNSGTALTSPLAFHHPWEKRSPLTEDWEVAIELIGKVFKALPRSDGKHGRN